VGPFPRRSRRRCQFSGVFDRICSSFVVKLHHSQTSWVRAQRRPLILRADARFFIFENMSLAILKFYLLSRFAGLPKSEKEFLPLSKLNYLLYIKIVLNKEVVFFISRLGQFKTT